MTTVNDRPIGLPTATRTHEALPLPSAKTTQSLPVRKAPVAAQALPGALPVRTIALPGAAPQGLPVTRKAPEHTPVAETIVEETAPVQKAVAPVPASGGSLPAFTRKTVEDLNRTKGLPAPVNTVSPALPVAKETPAPVQGFPVRTPAPVVEESVAPVVEEVSVKAVAPAVQASHTKRVAGPSVKVAVKKPKVDNKMSFRPTERDRKWLRCIYRYNLLTTNHLAYLEGISPDSARKRLTVLMKQGLIRHDARRSVRVWQITQAGIDFIRERGKVGTKFPSLLKYPHTMAIATIGITLEKGGPDAAAIVGNLLSEAPRNIITEREMQVMEGRKERSFIINNWDRLVDDLMHDDRFPVHPYDSMVTEDKLASWTEQDWEAFVATEVQEKDMLEARFRGPDKEDVNHTGYCHIVTSHNPKLVSNRNMGGKSIQGTTTHRPDALIVLPNVVQDDGTVTGGSIAIEIELNNKSTLAEYKNTILHQYSSRVYSRVFWYFDDADARRMFKQALKELSQIHNAPFTWEEAKAYFRPFNLALLNADLDAHGLYG